MEQSKLKIGIVTICSSNYGNRLQNYALQTFLTNSGFDCETIRRESRNGIATKIKACLRSIASYIFHTKGSRFRCFNRLIRWSGDVLSQTQVPKDLGKRYDFFIVGSDQVWNPNFSFISENEFLTFADKHQRIALSASFGVSKLPPRFAEKYAELLNGIPNITVREDAGKEIVYRLTGRHVDVLLDPTMMLSKQEWQNIAKKPFGMPKERYILIYFLSDPSETRRNYFQAVGRIAESTQIKIYDLSTAIKGKYPAVGPAEFIFLIDHASLVCTDSFHASVFSILTDVPFLVFNRYSEEGNMASRIDTLLSRFGLEGHRYGQDCFSMKDLFRCDYDKAKQVITAEKSNYLNYLMNATGFFGEAQTKNDADEQKAGKSFKKLAGG